MNWVAENKEWLFSGVAIALPLGLIGLFVAVLGLFVSSKKNKQVQKSGDNSNNIQVGGNINIGDKKNDG